MTKSIDTLQEMLHNGVVEFTYTKKNGETRQARGTKCWDAKIVGENFVAPNGKGSDKTGVVTYWDLDKDAWRCLGMDSLVSVEGFTHKNEFGVE